MTKVHRSPAPTARRGALGRAHQLVIMLACAVFALSVGVMPARAGIDTQARGLAASVKANSVGLPLSPANGGTGTTTSTGTGDVVLSHSPTLVGITDTCGTVVLSGPCIDVTQTWNAGAVVFTGLRYNFTDTASDPASLIADFQIGGTSEFKISKLGYAFANSYNPTSGGTIFFNKNNSGVNSTALINGGGTFETRSGGCYAWSQFSGDANGAQITQVCSPAGGVVQFQKSSAGAINTVSDLTTLGCGSAQKGSRAMVSDATVAASGNFGAAVTGGGSNVDPVYCDGTSWKIG